MQNDPPDEKTGIAPAEKWLLDVVSILGRVQVCRPPKEYKDVNQWTKDGFISGGELLQVLDEAPFYRDPKLPDIRPPLSLEKAMAFDPKNDPTCLMGRRYLCQGGSAIWVGGSGIGKSVMSLQAAIMFALGENLFGLEVVRPLKSVIVSAEDDFGDISETIQGVLKGMDIKPGTDKFNRVVENVLIFQENTLKGLAFIGWCEQLVREFKADLIWINPLLSFYTGNPSDPEKSSEFTGALSNMQANTNVCTMLVHHTGKPKEANTMKDWSVDDFSYIGLGSSVWTNWARAILVIQSLKQPPETFVLRFAKRGQRAGITNEDFQRVREVYLQHGTKGLAWEVSDFCPSEEENQTKGRPTKASWSTVSEAWDGSDKTTSELKALFVGLLSISDKTAGRVLSKWSGVHIIKNTNDMWVKANP